MNVEALAESVLRGKATAELKRLPDGTFAPKGRGQVLKPGMHVALPGGGGQHEIRAVGSVGVDGTALGTNQIQVAKDGDKGLKTISLEPGSATLHDAVPQSQRYREFASKGLPESPKSPGVSKNDIAAKRKVKAEAAKKKAKEPETLTQTLTGKDAEAHGFDQVHVTKNSANTSPTGAKDFKGKGYTAKGYGGKNGTAKGEGDTPEAAIQAAQANAKSATKSPKKLGLQDKMTGMKADAEGKYGGPVTADDLKADKAAKGTPESAALDAYKKAGGDDPNVLKALGDPDHADPEMPTSPTPAGPDAVGAETTSPPSASASQAAPPSMPAEGGGLQKNTEGIDIGSMTPGTVFEMNDGTQFKYHKPVNPPFHIVKPLDGGKAKPLHEKYQPPMVGSLGSDEGSGAAPGTPSAPPAGTPDDKLYDTLAKSVDVAKSGDLSTQQGEAIDKMHGSGFKSKQGPQGPSLTKTSPGRGPSGKLRNFKAMNVVKLQGVIAELEHHGEDAEALDAAKAALANKT